MLNAGYLWVPLVVCTLQRGQLAVGASHLAHPTTLHTAATIGGRTDSARTNIATFGLTSCFRGLLSVATQNGPNLNLMPLLTDLTSFQEVWLMLAETITPLATV